MSASLATPPFISAPLGGAAELAALVREAMAAEAERRILWVHLSRLPARLRKPHHRRLLESVLAPLGKDQRIRRFDLPNGDIAAVAVPPARFLDGLKRDLASLFDESDLSYLLTTLALPAEAAGVMAAIEETLGLGPAAAAEHAVAAPMPMADLASLERVLATADLTPFIRQQAICRLPPEGGEPELWARDSRISVSGLLEALAPGREVNSTPGLRRRLRRRLDDRLVIDLARPDSAARVEPRSLTLGLACLTAPSFLRLDAALPPSARKAMTIFVEAGDILAQPSSFVAAGHFLATRGYRLGLDILNPAVFDLLSPEGAGVGALRLTAATARQIDARHLRDLASRLDLVIAEADQTTAIAWGWQHGLSLFQGRAVERQSRRL